MGGPRYSRHTFSHASSRPPKQRRRKKRREGKEGEFQELRAALDLFLLLLSLFSCYVSVRCSTTITKRKKKKRRQKARVSV